MEPSPHTQTPQKHKEFKVAFVLSFFLGVLGIDRFYLGKIGTGILKLLTWGGLGIWYIIDVYLIAYGKTKDKQGNPLYSPDGPNETIKLFTLVWVLAQAAAFLIYLAMIPIFIFMASLPSGTPSTQYPAEDSSKYIAVQSAYELTREDPTRVNYPTDEYYAAELERLETMNTDARQVTYRALPAGCTGAVGAECTDFRFTTKTDPSFVVTSKNVQDMYMKLPSTYKCANLWPKSWIVASKACDQQAIAV